MLVTLDDTLEPVVPYRIPQTTQEMAKAFIDRTYNYKDRTVTSSLAIAGVQTTGDIGHRGYIQYLSYCWAHHLGAVLTPDILWQLVLGEVVGIIAADPEKYRSLFSTTGDKQTITVQGEFDNPQWMARVMHQLDDLVPTNKAPFLPEFSTTTPADRLARQAMFLQAVSPYYNYSVFCCGIPRIEVRGTVQDWREACAAASALAKLFPDELSYFTRVRGFLATIGEAVADSSRATHLFGQMFSMNRCGSGSQQEVSGWLTGFFREKPSLSLPENFPTGLAKVDFLYLPTNTNYQSILGIISSKDRGDGIQEPYHGHILLRKGEPVTVPY